MSWITDSHIYIYSVFQVSCCWTNIYNYCLVAGCELGNVDVVEDSSSSFTCNVSANSELKWAVYNEKRETIFLISCSQGSCKPPRGKLFEIYFDMWVDYYKYTLKIKSITRNSARTLSCNNSVKYSECELKIIGKLNCEQIVEHYASIFFSLWHSLSHTHTRLLWMCLESHRKKCIILRKSH